VIAVAYGIAALLVATLRVDASSAAKGARPTRVGILALQPSYKQQDTSYRS
jgi:hypothetical protein